MAIANTLKERINWDGGNHPFQAREGKLMMWYFLLSDAFTFTAFLLVYGFLRFSSPIWPDPNYVFNSMPFVHGVKIPLGFVTVMTAILIASSVFVVRAVQEGHRRNKNGVLLWLGLGILGGVAFIGCQAWEWSHLLHEGLWFNQNSLLIDPVTKITFYPHGLESDLAKLLEEGKITNIAETKARLVNAPILFSNAFFVITGFHGMHVLSGIVLNIIAWINTAEGVYEKKDDYEMIEKMGLYWHFVDLVWVFVFLCFYLL